MGGPLSKNSVRIDKCGDVPKPRSTDVRSVFQDLVKEVSEFQVVGDWSHVELFVPGIDKVHHFVGGLCILQEKFVNGLIQIFVARSQRNRRGSCNDRSS